MPGAKFLIIFVLYILGTCILQGLLLNSPIVMRYGLSLLGCALLLGAKYYPSIRWLESIAQRNQRYGNLIIMIIFMWMISHAFITGSEHYALVNVAMIVMASCVANVSLWKHGFQRGKHVLTYQDALAGVTLIAGVFCMMYITHGTPLGYMIIGGAMLAYFSLGHLWQYHSPRLYIQNPITRILRIWRIITLVRYGGSYLVTQYTELSIEKTRIMQQSQIYLPNRHPPELGPKLISDETNITGQ